MRLIIMSPDRKIEAGGRLEADGRLEARGCRLEEEQEVQNEPTGGKARGCRRKARGQRL